MIESIHIEVIKIIFSFIMNSLEILANIPFLIRIFKSKFGIEVYIVLATLL